MARLGLIVLFVFFCFLSKGDATLSRHKGINIQELSLVKKLAVTPSGESWRGTWQGNDIVAKILAVRHCTARISRDFNEEFPRLRIFSHPNVLPVIGCCNDPPNLIVINQFMVNGSLYGVLHEGGRMPGGMVVDTAQAVRFALDVARGMAFLHSLDKQLPNFHLSSKHVMVRELPIPSPVKYLKTVCWFISFCFARRLTRTCRRASAWQTLNSRSRIKAGATVRSGWRRKRCRRREKRSTSKRPTCGASPSSCGNWPLDRCHSLNSRPWNRVSKSLSRVYVSRSLPARPRTWPNSSASA